MKFVCKDCGEGVTGRIIVYKDKGKSRWILIDKNVRYWVNKLDGKVLHIENGIPVEHKTSRR